MKCLFAAVCLLLAAAPVRAGEAVVKLDVKESTVDVSIDGEPFAVFHFGKDLPKPFFSPVRGPDGTILTRPILTDRGQGDHPHQKGIWLAVDEVNGIKYWAEECRIESQSVKAVVPGGNPARLHVVNHWLDKQGEPLLKESTTISLFANRLVAYDIRLDARGRDVTFEDTKEGLFGFRMAESMREDKGGSVVNSDGKHGTKACWGQTADWVDYYGTVDGRTFGVALFDHPENFRPSRYHVRNYGLFSISPFGERAYTNGVQPAAPVTVKAGETLRLRYGLHVHAGDTQAGKVADAFRQFVQADTQ